MKLSPRTSQLDLRLSPELKAAAEEAAADDSRSLTSLIEKLLVDHLKAIGRFEHVAAEQRRQQARIAAAKELLTGAMERPRSLSPAILKIR